jgi:superfamily II RNA helicase
LDEVGINILAAALCFKSRPDTDYQPFDTKRLGLDFASLNQRMQRLANRQRAFGVDRPFEMLDPALSSVVNAWSKGCDFSELAKYTSAAEGDIIRALRRAINLLRQLEEALGERGEGRKGKNSFLSSFPSLSSSLRRKLGRCMARMKRGVVDAESELMA